MPRITLSVKDTDATVTRPVIMEVVRDILRHTGLEPETNILFPGNSEVAYQPDTTISSKNENREKNKFSHGKRVFIEVDEDYNEEGAIAAAVMKPENRFIYYDELIGSYIKPVYSSMETNITFKYRAKDRVEALRWRDHVRTKISLGRRDLIHHPSYYYVIPDSVFIMLKEIHRLRENVEGYGDTFREYVDNHFTTRKTIAVTQAGTEPIDVISETQRRVIGRFDFTTKPERMERSGTGDAWIISFSYRLFYEKPISLVMLYPLVVHNQLLNSKFRPDKPTDRDEFHELSHTMSTSGFRYFEPDYMIDKWKYTRGIAIPDFDDFIPSQILPSTVRVLTGLVLIEDNTNVLMNFNELGDWKLEEDIKRFLASESPWLTKRFESIFHVSLYRNHDLVDTTLNKISVDTDLNVLLNGPVSLRDYHHIRLSLLTDLDLLTDDAKDRLRQDSCVLLKILQAIYPGRDFSERFSRLGTCGPVTKDEFEDIIKEVTPYPDRSKESQRIGYNTVQGFFIRSRRNEDINK